MPLDWPVDLPPSVGSVVLNGGMICLTTLDRLADGRDVVVKRCPYPAEVEAEGLRALAAAGGNKSEAARAMGLARSTFLGRLKKVGLA